VTKTRQDSPGWTAIDRAIAQVLPGAEPLHWGTEHLPDEGVYGINAFRAADHWLYVTYGLTELFGKASDDPEVSGWGFELTMRVPIRIEAPPNWPSRLLKSLGDYVFSTANVFEPTHRFDPGGPITGEDDTLLCAVAFDEDPQLRPIATPHGRVDFLTVFGITQHEYAAMRRSTTMTVLDRIKAVNPLLVTDRERGETELGAEAVPELRPGGLPKRSRSGPQ
jgi:hypothetical protein